MKNKISDIRLGKKAQHQFEENYQLLKKKRGNKAAQCYVEDFEQTLHQIKKTPYCWEESRTRKGARRALFGKYGAFLYRVYSKFIRVVSIYDTRQNNQK